MLVCRCILLGFFFLGLLSLISPHQYHFVELFSRLFAIEGTAYWRVVRPRVAQANSSHLTVDLLGPYKLFTRKTAVHFNFTRSQLRFAFTGQLSPQCTLLFLVNHRLNYQVWSVQAKPPAGLFTLADIPPENGTSQRCTLPRGLPRTGNLRSLPPLAPLFSSNQTVSSVLSVHNQTALLFVAFNLYLQLRLPTLSVKVVPLAGSLAHLKLHGLYKNRHALQDSGRGLSSVCQVRSLQLLQLTGCTKISFKRASAAFSQVKLLAIQTNGSSTEMKSNPDKGVLLWMLILVLVSLCLLTGLYTASLFSPSQDASLAPSSGGKQAKVSPAGSQQRSHT